MSSLSLTIFTDGYGQFLQGLLHPHRNSSMDFSTLIFIAIPRIVPPVASSSPDSAGFGSASDESDQAKLAQVVFLVKGPIYLVCISCTEEPFESLRGQLELLYGQMIVILTKSVNRCFEKNPKFDMTPLLGGTDAVFSSLIHSFSWNPVTFLHAYTCLPLAYPTAGAILQDVADSGVLFAILLCKHKVTKVLHCQGLYSLIKVHLSNTILIIVLMLLTFLIMSHFLYKGEDKQ